MYNTKITDFGVIQVYSQIRALLLSSHVALDKTFNLSEVSISSSVKLRNNIYFAGL